MSVPGNKFFFQSSPPAQSLTPAPPLPGSCPPVPGYAPLPPAGPFHELFDDFPPVVHYSDRDLLESLCVWLFVSPSYRERMRQRAVAADRYLVRTLSLKTMMNADIMLRQAQLYQQADLDRLIVGFEFTADGAQALLAGAWGSDSANIAVQKLEDVAFWYCCGETVARHWAWIVLGAFGVWAFFALVLGVLGGH